MDSLQQKASQVVRSRYGIILPIIAINILVGVLVVGHYGESWDEQTAVRNALLAVGSFRGITDLSQPSLTRHNYHGPFYNLMVQGLVRSISLLFPALPAATARHLVNFLTFQMAVLALYALCLRLVGKAAALGATLLFATQPLLFGHAFINHKDSPFMAFFLAVIVAGLAMVSAYQRQGADGVRTRLRELRSSAGHEWRSKSTAVKGMIILLTAIALTVLLDVLLADRLVYGLVRISLSSAAQVSQWAVTYPRVQVPIVLAIFTIAVLTGSFVFVQTVNRVWANRFTRFLILGGLLMGWATSMRFIGPFAGVLVSAYFLSRARSKAIAPLVVYWAIAGLASFATWPFLWNAPLRHYLEAVRGMSNFPWTGPVLYRGIVFENNHDLPATFLPHLMALQFTETALALTAIGLLVAVRRLWSGKIDRALLILVVVWFGLPLVAQILLRVPVYDNFRHFLYIVPPLFVLGSIGLDAILGLLRNDVLKSLAIVLALLPGIVGIIRLHPYEYTYYNALVGGTRGASGRYELDYWCTSYQETFAHLNDVAEPGAVISVWGPYHLAETRLRDDLEMYGVPSEARPGWVDTRTPNYAVICGRTDMIEWLYGEAETIYQVQRGGAALSVIKRVD